VPGLDEQGLDLLEHMLKCNPADRITAKDAMRHPYLDDVPDEIRHMK
jgi:serine/threonine protein kinase